MNKKQLINLIKEEATQVLNESKIPLSEGILDSIVNLIVGRKLKPILSKLNKDPEVIAARRALDKAIDDANQAYERSQKAMERYEKEKAEWEKSGKKIKMKGGAWIY
jgi:ribosomal protein L12E/L44/L45/RPP1/RPP2